jgi:hypothetical protein
METWADSSEVLNSLSSSLNSYDWATSTQQCIRFIQRLDKATEPFPERTAKTILNLLRRKRQFSLMELVADAFIRNGQSSPQILRQYGQALIDRGSLTAATMILESIVADSRSPIAEKAEASGLLGRIYKQLYVNANDPANPRQQGNLIQAIHKYYDVYKTNPASFYWHGINTLALLCRASRDRIPVSLPVTDTQIAAQITTLLQKDELDAWESATAVENAIATGDFQGAYDHAVFFASHPAVDAFEIGSLLRQLTEVWQLSADKEPGANLVPLLNAALLRRQGGEITVPATHLNAVREETEQAQKGLEKVFGRDRYYPLEWYKTGLKRCAAVGRVESITGQKIGTGFLVRAQDFFPKRNEKELIFLTNAHVIGPPGALTAGAITPTAARVQFEATGTTCPVTELIWSSPVSSLDATFVALTNMEAAVEICPLVPDPAPFISPAGGQRLYVIGYPLGGGLSFSLQDSNWLDTDGRVLHYRTPTEPGSSGSPVFDQDYWTVVALHHKGRTDMPRLNGQTGNYEANEGIAMKAIQKATCAA